MTKTILITGTNRGIGFEFARQYAEDGWQVHACCRKPEKADQLHTALNGKTAQIHKLDVSDQDSINALKAKLSDQPVDILLNNAGIMGGDDQSFGNIDYPAWENTLRTNTIGPHRMFEAFSDNLLSGFDKKVVNISSIMGSIEKYQNGGQYIYRSSKTALNMVTVNLDYEFNSHAESQGICFLAFHPGWVQTDMGGQQADITPSESASYLRQSIANATLDDSSKLLNFDGSPLPW